MIIDSRCTAVARNFAHGFYNNQLVVLEKRGCGLACGPKPVRVCGEITEAPKSRCKVRVRLDESPPHQPKRRTITILYHEGWASPCVIAPPCVTLLREALVYCSRISGAIPRNFDQNRWKIRWKQLKNSWFFRKIYKKCEKVWRVFAEIFSFEWCKGVTIL